jgi:hypothetical protein
MLRWHRCWGIGVTYASAVMSAGGHLGAGIAEAFVILESFLNGVGRFTFALEVIGVVLL